MAQLHDLTALEQGAGLRRGEFTSVELTEHYLRRSESIGPSVGAFVTLMPQLALEQARAADAARRLNPSGLGPLHGVVVPVKDLNNLAGVRITYGSAIPSEVAFFDDYIVVLMRRAGLIFTGKTNTPEFGLPCYTENAVAPPARTPWDLTRSAGGSSGGAAASVAAGLASAAQGSDGGGSIRIPASVCGLVGLKPSRYRVSGGPLGDLLGDLTVEGPIGRTVADVAALLDVMATPFDDDPAVLMRPKDGFLAEVTRPPGRLRIGRYAKPVISNAPVDRQCLAAFESASQLLVDLGHEVLDISPPFDDGVVPLFETIWASLALWAPIPPEHEPTLTPLTRWLREKGRGYSGFDIATAVSTIRLLARAALRTSAEFDAILTPTLGSPPALVGGLRNDQDPAADFEAQKAFTPFTSPYNVTGQPAITLPLYWTEQGLPIGIQLVGRIAGEGPLLALAAQLEAASPWVHRRPDCW